MFLLRLLLLALVPFPFRFAFAFFSSSFLVQEVTSFVRHFSETCPPWSCRKCVFVLHADKRQRERTSSQTDKRIDRETDGQTVSPSAPNKCPGRKWSALTVFLSLPSLGLFIFVSAAVALGKSETNVILSCRNSKENCDRTLSLARGHLCTVPLLVSIYPYVLSVVFPVSYVTLWRRRGASLDKIYGACVKIRERLLPSQSQSLLGSLFGSMVLPSLSITRAPCHFSHLTRRQVDWEKKTKLRSPTLFPTIPSSPLTRRHRVLPDVYPRVYRLQLQQH